MLIKAVLMQNNNDNPQDEIDLYELCAAIWQRKWVVCGVTVLFIMVAVFYVALTPKTYQAAVLLSPVQSADVALLNMGKLMKEATMTSKSL